MCTSWCCWPPWASWPASAPSPMHPSSSSCTVSLPSISRVSWCVLSLPCASQLLLSQFHCCVLLGCHGVCCHCHVLLRCCGAISHCCVLLGRHGACYSVMAVAMCILPSVCTALVLACGVARLCFMVLVPAGTLLQTSRRVCMWCCVRTTSAGRTGVWLNKSACLRVSCPAS